MDRKAFLTILATAPGACCGLAAQSPQGTQCEKRFDFAQTWLKRLMVVLETDADPGAADRVLEAMGRACFHASRPPQQEAPDLDKTLARLAAFAGRDNVKREDNVIDINLNNKACLCPFTQEGPQGLPPSYCKCSAGYMKASFEPFGGNPKVQVLETIKGGGKSCRFRITLAKA